MGFRHTSQSKDTYRQRLLQSMVVVLVLVIAFFQWWPVGTPQSADGPFRTQADERIQVEEVQPTSQSRERRPAPPAPLPPVVKPADKIIESEIEFGDAELHIENPEDDRELQHGTEQVSTARTPDVGARLLRNVQPNYPKAAQKKDIRARIRVEVKVADNGRVQDAFVQKRWLLSENGEARPVTRLGYGLEEAALTAARQSHFRPARAEGSPVSSRTSLTFTFGDQ